MDLKKSNHILVKSFFKKNHVCIDVTDTGKGIAPEILPKIFEPFFTTKPEGIGTGLGLSLCYDIIKSLGGYIDVKSNLGIGSTFSINLPINLRTQEKIPERKTLSKNVSQKKLLVIYNDRYLSNKVHDSLKNIYDLTFIQYGRDALQTLATKPDRFDLIICEFQMPDIDGNDIYQFIISNNLKQRFIFITPNLKNKSISDFCKNKKNVIFIKRDFLLNQFLNAVDKMLTQ